MYDDYDYDDRHRGRNRDSRWDDGRDRQDYRSRSPRSREYRHSWHEREGRGPAPSLLPPRDSPPPSVNSPGKPGSSSHNIRPRTSLHRYKVQLERTEREEEERLAAEQKYFQAGPRDVDRADDAGPRYSLEPPSDTVVLVGLGDDRPRDLVEQQIQQLKPEGLLEVRIRRDQSGRPLGFVHFKSVEAAVNFVQRYRPHIWLDFPVETDRCELFYSQERRPEAPAPRVAEWICRQCRLPNPVYSYACFNCQFPAPLARNAHSAPPQPILTGETDACPQQRPSQILVVRGLHQSVDEKVLAEGVSQLLQTQPPDSASTTVTKPETKLKSTAIYTKPEYQGARPRSLRRVFLVRDRDGDHSWGYGFAEFATLDDAQAAQDKFNKMREGSFLIGGSPATTAYIHTGVFVPYTEGVTELTPRFTFISNQQNRAKLKYWDDRAYASEYTVHAEPSDAPPALPSTAEKRAGPEETAGDDSKTVKKRKLAKESDHNPRRGIAMAPQMQMWANKSAELRGSTKRDAQAAGGEDSRSRVTDGSRGSKQADLAKDGRTARQESPSSGNASSTRPDGSSSARERRKLSKDLEVPAFVSRNRPRDVKDTGMKTIMSFADMSTLRCMLCRREFRNYREVRRHELKSRLHEANAKDKALVGAAKRSLAAMGLRVKKVHFYKRSAKDYRDRARQRREAYNQPAQPGRASTTAASELPKDKMQPIKFGFGGGSDKKAATTAGSAPALPTKGAALLGKMGWKAGTGLGADGKGRTETIKTEAYVPGAGLGAQGAKLGDAAEEARRRTKDRFEDFKDKMRDKTRERYERG